MVGVCDCLRVGTFDLLGKAVGYTEGLLLVDGLKLIDGFILGEADRRLLGLSVGVVVGKLEGTDVG